MTGEVEERQGEPAAEDSIETLEGGESPGGQVEPEEEGQGQETGGEIAISNTLFAEGRG